MIYSGKNPILEVRLSCVNLGKRRGLPICEMETKLLTSQNYGEAKAPNTESAHEWLRIVPYNHWHFCVCIVFSIFSLLRS